MVEANIAPDLVSDIARARTPRAVWRYLQENVGQFGYSAICYHFIDGAAAGRSAANAHASPIDLDFSADMVREHGWFDAAARVAILSGRPVRWSTPRPAPECSGPGEANDGNLAAGYLLPCFGPVGRHAIIEIAWNGPAETMDDDCVPLLLLFAQLVHSRAHALLHAAPPQRMLSRREEQVLGWVALGKSNGVIGEILGVSDKTVDTYMRRIFAKLGVADRTTAVLKAAGLGLLAA